MIAPFKKQRGIHKGSILRLSDEMQLAIGEPEARDAVQRMKEKLIALDLEFKTHHYREKVL